MFCKYCGENLKDGSKFCTECGATLSNTEGEKSTKPSLDLKGFKNDFKFNQETVLMSIKITGVAYLVTYLFSIITSLLYYVILSRDFFKNYKFSDSFKVLNNSLFNKLVVESNETTLRVILLLIIPLIAFFISYKLFYRKSELVSTNIIALLNAGIFAVFNLILSLIIKIKIPMGFGEVEGSFASLYSFVNTFIIVLLFSLFFSYINDIKKFIKEQSFTDIIKPIFIITILFASINMILFVIYTREHFSLNYLLGLIILIPNILVHFFLFLIGIPFNSFFDLSFNLSSDTSFGLFGIDIVADLGSGEIYRHFVFINIILFIVVVLLLVLSFYKLYNKNKDKYWIETGKSIGIITIMNTVLSIYSKQVVKNDYTDYIESPPITTFFVTLLVLSAIAVIVFFIAKYPFVKIVNTFYNDFKLIFYIVLFVITLLFTWLGYHSDNNSLFTESIYEISSKISSLSLWRLY